MKALALLLILPGLAGADDWLPKLHPGGKPDAPRAAAGTGPDMFSIGRLLAVCAQASEPRSEPNPATFPPLEVTSP